MNIPNNQDRIALRINLRFNVGAVADDGSVCINNPSVSPEREDEIRNFVQNNLRVSRIGDGVQEGSLYINGHD